MEQGNIGTRFISMQIVPGLVSARHNIVLAILAIV